MFSGISWAGLLSTGYPPGTVPGTWQVDRYAPASFANAGSFAGRNDVLALHLAVADSRANRPAAFNSTFYNTQGRGLALNLSAYAVVYGSLHVPAAWATSAGPAENRRTDMWAQASPATGSDTCSASGCNFFPYIGFSNTSLTDPLNAGGSGRFRVWDGTVGAIELTEPVQYDQWNDVCIAFSGTDLKSYINGALAYTQSNMTHNDVATLGPTTHFSRVLMQAYNFGADYTAHWSALGAGQLDGIQVQAGSGQTALPDAGFALSLEVLARDTSGAPLPCTPVTFAAPASGPSAQLSAVTVITDRQGVAKIQATANELQGSYVVSAMAPGMTDAINFDLRNAAAMPPVAAPVLPVPVGGWGWLLACGLGLLTVVGTRMRRSH